MEPIYKDQIESLAQFREWPAISVYMPVSRVGDRQDALRYKNLITEVENRLTREKMSDTEIGSLLEPEYRLAKEVDYWKHLGADGLAVFLSKGSSLHYALPISFDEQLTVGQHFHIRPLLPLLIGGDFLVLALNRNKLQLFHGDRYRLKEINLPEGTPHSIAEALQYDDLERELQFHTKTGSSMGQRDAMFHGHGVGFDDQNENLIRYFQAVDRSLFPQLEDEKVPVILAGTEELHGIYRDISRSHTLFSQGIVGNVGDLPVAVLHGKAWEIVRNFFMEKERRAVRKFQDSLGGDKALVELQSVMLAAHDGRVENLFVVENEQLWGEFDSDKRLVLIKQEPAAGQTIDLLDEAVF